MRTRWRSEMDSTPVLLVSEGKPASGLFPPSAVSAREPDAILARLNPHAQVRPVPASLTLGFGGAQSRVSLVMVGARTGTKTDPSGREIKSQEIETWKQRFRQS
jgi:hypothetical protein